MAARTGGMSRAFATVTRSLIPPRRDIPELMDAPGLPEAEVASAYRTLRRVNRQLGNQRTLLREADRFLREKGWSPLRGVTALDVGSGAGDLPARLGEFLRAAGLAAKVVALDRDPTAVALARREGLPVVLGDALRLPFADRSVDLVTAVKFAHHFNGPSLHRLLSEMARVAARRVVVLDIRRHWVAYLGIVAWSRAFTRDRLVRHDGPVSVLRGFTAAELSALGASVPDFTWAVRGYLGFQLALVGRRIDPPSPATAPQRP
jgi:ubiquinone/menaquinone biosynthesis C-methylase UbiE